MLTIHYTDGTIEDINNLARFSSAGRTVSTVNKVTTDDDFLIAIRKQFDNLPDYSKGFPMRNLPVSWYDDHARFIVANLEV